MGSGVSALCGNKRSVLIINSVRKLPPIPESEADSDIEPEIEIQPRSGKLHAAESRDSGIGENDIPNYIQRINGSGFLRNSSNESSPEKKKEKEIGGAGDAEMTSSRPSRPHSCRLGHRGHPGSAKRTRRTEVSESQIRRMVQSGKRQSNNVQSFNLNDSSDKTLDFSDNDTLSNHSSSSPARDQRPKSAKRRHRRNARTRDSRNSARNIRDLDTSTESDISDTDMLSIPDETGSFHRGKNNGDQRRGWVGTEDFTDIMVTSSRTPRTPGDFYKIVSGSFSDADLNLAKTASERSISGVILTPVDGSCTSTNLECFDAPNDCLFHNEGNLDDLVNSLVKALERQRVSGSCSKTDYENVMKGLRYQLVAMAMAYMCRQSTPRIEIQGEKPTLFSDEPWRVQIRLRADDEEILELSEKTLAERLVQKGSTITKDDISILLAEHLRTIEKLQKVSDTWKLIDQSDAEVTPRMTSPEGSVQSVKKRPGSGKGRRKVQAADLDTQSVTSNLSVTENKPSAAGSDKTNQKTDTQYESASNRNLKLNRLPPISPNKSKSEKSKLPPLKSKSKTPQDQNLKKSQSNSKQNDTTGEQDSLQSSPETRAKNRRNLNESGIDSECDETETLGYEEEEAFLVSELVEAFYILWDNLLGSDVRELLKEYRRRQTSLLTSFGLLISGDKSKISKTFIALFTGTERPTKLTWTTNKDETSEVYHTQVKQAGKTQMVPRPGYPDDPVSKEIACLDEEFIRRYSDGRQHPNYTFVNFCDCLSAHMKKTKLIRVQSFRSDGEDWSDNGRSHSFTGFGQNRQNTNICIKRQHSFSGASARQISSQSGSSRQNSFLRSLPSSRQSSYHRTRSRGSTGSSYTLSSTTSSGVGSEPSDGLSSLASRSALSREFSYGLLNDFEDIEELDEESKTARDARPVSDNLRPPSGPRSNAARASSANLRDRDRRRGQTQVHGLGPTPVEPLRKIDEDSMPKVEDIENKMKMRSRPDSGIAVSTSSASYASSEPHKDITDDIDDPCLTTSCQEMMEKVKQVLADVHNDMKSLVAAITKGLNSEHLKAQALYCWLASQDLNKFTTVNKKSSSPSGRLKQLSEKKTLYSAVYMDMLKIAGLKCDKIDGFIKNKDYLPGNTVQTTKFQHSWVAVFMDGHFRLVDPECGSSGDIFVMDHFFATSPDELLMSHFPKDKKWQLMSQAANIEAFEGTLKTWPAMFHFNIRPLNMKAVVRTFDGKLSITVLLQNVAVNPQLEYGGPGPDIDSDTLEEQIDHEIRDVDNAETYHVTLPQEGVYYFTVHAHVLEDCIDVPVFQYRIEYKDELL